jgi:hypothetical protein
MRIVNTKTHNLCLAEYGTMPDFSMINPTVVTLVLGDQIVPLPSLAVSPGGELTGLPDHLLGLMQENNSRGWIHLQDLCHEISGLLPPATDGTY